MTEDPQQLSPSQAYAGPASAAQSRTRGAASWAQGHPAGVAFTFVMITGLAWAFSTAGHPFYYDSQDYWNYRESFVVHGHFSLLNFDDPAHGYLMSLICLGLQQIANAFGLGSSAVVRVWNVGVFALLATVLLPGLAQAIWPERSFGVRFRVLLAAVFFVLWGGDLGYPLTDFPALAAAVLTLVALVRAQSKTWMAVAGLSAGSALELRPAYIVLLPMGGLIALWDWWRSRKSASHSRRALALLVGILGFGLVAIPQSLIARRHFHITSFVPGAAVNITSLDFSLGLTLQRHDTYIGPGSVPSTLPNMNFVDPSGTKLLQSLGGTVTSTGDLLSIIVRHPGTMLGVAVRHLVNGLDDRYSGAYVANLRSNAFLRCLGFLLVFLGLVRFGWPAARRSLGPIRWRFVIAMLVLAAPALTTPTETRYMLGATSLAYVSVLAPGWPRSLGRHESGRRRFAFPGFVLIALCAFAVVVILVVHGATHNLVLAA